MDVCLVGWFGEYINFWNVVLYKDRGVDVVLVVIVVDVNGLLLGVVIVIGVVWNLFGKGNYVLFILIGNKF